MKKIALTGNIATGKTSVEKIFNCKFDIPVIDADKIAHDLLEYDLETIKQVKKTFEGFDILKPCGGLSRPKIATVVFENESKRIELEKILHPKIRNKIKEFFKKNQDEKIAIASVALLYEVNWQDDFDEVILVTCDEKTQLERLIKRANIKKEEALKRINAQMSQDEKIKKADYIIENNSSFEDLETATKNIYDKIKTKK